MKIIALTGDPFAQHNAEIQLLQLLIAQVPPLAVSVVAGLVTRAEAYHIHHQGGEVWLCGPEAPRRELVGVITAATPEAVADQAATCLAQFISKTHIAGEPA
jgi:hypothetical protein